MSRTVWKRWIEAGITTRSGKSVFICTICGNLTPVPGRACPTLREGFVLPLEYAELGSNCYEIGQKLGTAAENFTSNAVDSVDETTMNILQAALRQHPQQLRAADVLIKDRLYVLGYIMSTIRAVTKNGMNHQVLTQLYSDLERVLVRRDPNACARTR